ncbi:MAG: hypothetical protein SGI92_23580 [Bryobacteraceae bacterium]|nr:hypothetical protein [Bryobacteraceae bacterium]
MLKVGKQFLTHVMPAVIKPIRILWNELIGFVFISFAVLLGFQSWRKFTDAGDNGQMVFWSMVGGGFSLMLLWYGLSSFLRARKISRS